MLLTDNNYLTKQQATMLVAIDPAVEAPQSLASGVQPNATVLLLDPHQDSIAQITKALTRGNYHSLHLVSHGSPGCLHLGNTDLSSETIAQYKQQLLEWGVAKILIYGCNVAADPELLKQLHFLTGASIAASAQEVGQGNWTLEWQIGEITAELAFGEELRQKYQGRFVTFTESATSSNDSPNGVALGDVDGDGDIDKVVTNTGNTESISVLLNDGSGGFTNASTFAVAGPDPRGVALGNFDGDTFPDLAVANYEIGGSGRLSILFNNGSGGFPTESTYSTGSSPLSVAIGDFDDDGDNDVVTANTLGNNVSVLLNNGSGQFPTESTFGTGNSPADVAVGDFGGDTFPDLVVANFTYPSAAGSISLLLNNGSGQFPTNATFSVGDNPNGIVVADFDGDNDDDIATANYYFGNAGGSISVRLGNGAGSFGAESTYLAEANTYDVAVGDFNSDGELDIAASNDAGDSVSVFIGDGSGGFAAQETFGVGTPGPSQPRRLAAGEDLDGDTFIDDIAVANGPENEVSLLTADVDLSVTKIDSPDPVDQGNPLTYTITVTNNDPSVAASGVVVTDDLDPNVTFVSASDGGSLSGGDVVWNLGTLAGGTVQNLTLDVTVNNDAPLGTDTLNNTVTVTSTSSDQDPSNNAAAEATTVECFLTGTQILTDKGEIAVENLKIGDLVQTADGKPEPIKWIGRQTIKSNQVKNPLRGYPVLIKAGALGNNLPHRDLYVSPDHSMFVEGLLINAGALVNDISIIKTEPTESFTYYHVELENHALLVAEGAAAESYLPQKENRDEYDNFAEYEELYPHGSNLMLWPMDYPRISSWNKVPRFISKKLRKIAYQLEEKGVKLRA